VKRNKIKVNILINWDSNSGKQEIWTTGPSTACFVMNKSYMGNQLTGEGIEKAESIIGSLTGGVGSDHLIYADSLSEDDCSMFDIRRCVHWAIAVRKKTYLAISCYHTKFT
jgi:hypothetical protein